MINKPKTDFFGID